MSGTVWGGFVWGAPEPVYLTGLEEQMVKGHRIGLTVGKAIVGCVCWYRDDGPYYPLTQCRRFGPMRDLAQAKLLVEELGVLDAITYPTLGRA